MAKQILTLDNLYQFFVDKNETVNFSIKESGKPIVVRTNGFFEADEDDMPGMLKLKLKVCHTEVNRNGSNISKENMEKAMPTLKYRPILAYIHELPDGTKDFYAHNMEIVENEDGDAEIVYIEKQVGCFTADKPWLEYDKDMDKTYVMAYAVIPEDYTEAADIIRRKNGTKVSCELVINELSYNAKEKYLDLTDFYFGGTTLLGCDEDGNEIGEGMLGARADITDFCYKEPIFTYQDKMIEVLDKLNTTLSNFNTTTIQKGGCEMNKFEELLEKYGITAEDVTFETEGLSDEDLEVAFKEAFEDDDSEGADDNEGADGDNSDGEEETEDEDTSDEDTSDEGGSDDSASDEGTSTDGDDVSSLEEIFTKTFAIELSHDDIRYALYNLISQYDEEDNEWYCIKSVYDNYFYMQGWYNNKIYKLGYAVDGENVSLEGERQEMFELIVSESEKLAIEKMREDYAVLVEYKANAEAEKLQAQKDVVFGDEKFASIVDTKLFKSLVADSANYSVEECEQKANDILEDFAAFASNADVNKAHSVSLNFTAKEKKNKKAYGNLFAN